MLMRRALLIAIATLASATPAQATAPPPDGIQRGLQVAQRMFGTPPCGTPKVAVLATLGRTDGAIGQARAETCMIELAFNYPWSGGQEACTITVHEWGHLALGPRFGGSDPWHSIDPRSIMHPTREFLQACVPKRLRVQRVRWKHRRMRHHRQKVPVLHARLR